MPRVHQARHTRTIECLTAKQADSAVSASSAGRDIFENFAPLLILEVTQARDLVEFDESPGKFNFFRGMQTTLLVQTAN